MRRLTRPGKTALIVSFLLILVLLLLPFETAVVPAWDIRFTDDAGNTIANVEVEQICYNYTYTETNICADSPDARQKTGADGLVRFSPKSIRLNVLSRIVRSVFFYLTTFAHGNIGIRAYLSVSCPLEYESVGLIEYIPDQPVSEIILTRKK